MVDLFLYKKDHLTFIRQVCSPLNVKIFSREQLKIAKTSLLKVLYFDATGAVVGNTGKDEKRILYYAVILTLAEKSLYPIMEMISCEHDTHAIFDLFYKFKKFCQEKNSWPLFKVFVSDFSFANLKAASKAFNNMDLQQYLSFCFEHLQKKDAKFPKNKVILFLCCAHFIKNLIELIEDQTKSIEDKIIKRCLKTIFAVAFNVKNLQEATK